MKSEKIKLIDNFRSTDHYRKNQSQSRDPDFQKVPGLKPRASEPVDDLVEIA
jgi:hypothetical protein